MSEWKESKLEHKYTPLPEEPRYTKKKQKKKVIKSDHKHYYEDCLFRRVYVSRSGTKGLRIYGGTYCPICGRVGNIDIGASNIINENLPMFNLPDTPDYFFTKRINLEDISEN